MQSNSKTGVGNKSASHSLHHPLGVKLPALKLTWSKGVQVPVAETVEAAPHLQ